MDEYLEFESFCDSLNKECINLQSIDREFVSSSLAFEAYVYISQMRLELPGDFLLFLSCLNLLNVFIKQPNSEIKYVFKTYIDYFLEACLKRCPDIIKINEEKDSNGKIIIISIFNIQFSFHNVSYKYEEIINNFDDSITWDGIRKQVCSVTIFNKCKNNNILKSNITYRGKNLRKKVNKYLDNYSKGLMTFNSKLD